MGPLFAIDLQLVLSSFRHSMTRSGVFVAVVVNGEGFSGHAALRGHSVFCREIGVDETQADVVLQIE